MLDRIEDAQSGIGTVAPTAKLPQRAIGRVALIQRKKLLHQAECTPGSRANILVLHLIAAIRLHPSFQKQVGSRPD